MSMTNRRKLRWIHGDVYKLTYMLNHIYPGASLTRPLFRSLVGQRVLSLRSIHAPRLAAISLWPSSDVEAILLGFRNNAIINGFRW